MSLKSFLTAIVIATAVSAGLFFAVRMSAPEDPRSAFVLPSATSLPQFSLLRQSGAPVDATAFRGHWNLVFFGFTHCPDICPATLQILAAARRALAEDGQDPLPRIVLVSVDPERDTPELMGQYVSYFGEGNLGVTGTLDELTKLTSALGIYFEKQDADDDGNYVVDHSAAVLVINPAGEFHALFGGPHQVDDYVHDLPIIMAAKIDVPLPPLAAQGVVVMRPMPGMRMSAGYLALSNNTDAEITITRVSSDQFGSVELHESIVEDGVARMREIEALVIPAGGTVTLERGGKHLMLMRPTGDSDLISLSFFDGDDLLLDVVANYQEKE